MTGNHRFSYPHFQAVNWLFVTQAIFGDVPMLLMQCGKTKLNFFMEPMALPLFVCRLALTVTGSFFSNYFLLNRNRCLSVDVIIARQEKPQLFNVQLVLVLRWTHTYWLLLISVNVYDLSRYTLHVVAKCKSLVDK